MKLDSEQRPALAGLKRLRNALGLSQLQLAEILGIDPKCISRYETEHLVPRGRLLYRMCKVLQCELWELFFDPEIHSRAA